MALDRALVYGSCPPTAGCRPQQRCFLARCVVVVVLMGGAGRGAEVGLGLWAPCAERTALLIAGSDARPPGRRRTRGPAMLSPGACMRPPGAGGVLRRRKASEWRGMIGAQVTGWCEVVGCVFRGCAVASPTYLSCAVLTGPCCASSGPAYKAVASRASVAANKKLPWRVGYLAHVGRHIDRAVVCGRGEAGVAGGQGS